MRPLLLLAALVSACAPRQGPGPGGPDPGAVTDVPVSRLPFAELRDVACAPDGCLALTAAGLVKLDAGFARVVLPGTWDTLRWTGERFEIEGPCDAGRCAAPLGADLAPATAAPVPATAPKVEDAPPPLVDQAKGWEGWWNLAISKGWRAGFRRVLIGPGGGLITWSRGGEGVGQLVRTGMPRTFVRIPVPASAVSWPAWLAMHPTGAEAYLMAWPSTALVALDPVTLQTRWSAPLDGAGAGLFVDPGGRWILAEVGDGRSDRFLDWPTLALDPAPADDPFRDEVLRDLPRPDARAVVVIDVAAQAVVARASGRYRRFLPRGDGWVLATDREVVRPLP